MPDGAWGEESHEQIWALGKSLWGPSWTRSWRRADTETVRTLRMFPEKSRKEMNFYVGIRWVSVHRWMQEIYTEV